MNSKVITTIIAIFISQFILGQNKVELRDVSFNVPNSFYYFTELDRKIDYKEFYETGKISTDSLDIDKYPKIQYQYYEIPDFGLENSKTVLIRLNEIMTKDFPADSLIINEEENYSLAKYSILGKSIFDIKNLGNKGYLNIQYSDLTENDKISFDRVNSIIQSIDQKYIYYSKYDEHVKEGAEHSKRAIIILIISIIFLFIGKQVRENITK